MISTRKISALFAKDAKSIMHNVFVLSGVLIIPVVAFVFGLIAEEEIMMTYLVMVAQMNILMNGANIICVMIAEEKEKHTLGVLKASTVSGLDFLIAKLLITVLVTSAVSALVFFMFGMNNNMNFGMYMLLTTVAILPAAAIGAIIGIATKTQSAASSVVAPFALVLLFVPIVVHPESGAWRVLRFMFSEQLVYGLRYLYNNEPVLGMRPIDSLESFWVSIGIILANFAVLFAIFLVFYRRKGLATG